jgi:hypothetical protein
MHRPGECKSESVEPGANPRQQVTGQPLTEARRDYETFAPMNLPPEGEEEIEGEYFGGPEPGPAPGAFPTPPPGEAEIEGEYADDFGFEGERGPYESGCPECPGMLDEFGRCPDCGYQDPQHEHGMAHEFEQRTFHDPAADVALRDEWGYTPTRRHQVSSHQLEGQPSAEPVLTEEEQILAALDADLITEADLPQYKLHQGAPGDHAAPKPSEDAEGGDHGKMGHLGGTSVNTRKLAKNSGLPQEKTDTADMGKEWPRKHKETPAMCDVDPSGVEEGPQGGHESTHGDPDDGHQCEIRNLNLRTKQKNTGQQWEKFEGWLEGAGGHGLHGGAKKMQENVERLNRHVLNFLRRRIEESQLLQPGAKYKGAFVISAGEYVRPRQHSSMTEALVDTEELLQIFGPSIVTMEARYLDGNNQVVLRELVPLPSLPLRGPIMAEHKALFRFAELARDYADMLVESGHACSALTHNWGAAVSANLPYAAALRVYHAIREGVPALPGNLQEANPG